MEIPLDYTKRHVLYQGKKLHHKSGSGDTFFSAEVQVVCFDERKLVAEVCVTNIIRAGCDVNCRVGDTISVPIAELYVNLSGIKSATAYDELKGDYSYRLEFVIGSSKFGKRKDTAIYMLGKSEEVLINFAELNKLGSNPKLKKLRITYKDGSVVFNFK